MGKKKKSKGKSLVPANEVKEIMLKVDDLIDKSNVFMQLTTRGADPNSKALVDFRIFDDAKLAKLAENMPEVNRATRVFGRQNSQATGKLMSLNMISQSPYRRLKQCLAKIERKRQALKENIFRLRKEKIEMDRLLHRKAALQKELDSDVFEPGDDPIHTEFDIQLLDIEIQEKAANISDSNIYIEGALKEIGMYQDAYNQIKKSYNIPDNWDEEDFEKMEVEEHVKTAFLHAIRDVEMTGRLNVGTHEYLEQYGINPHTALRLVQMYLGGVEKLTQDNNFTNITVLYEFLDQMYDTFKDEYKHAMKRIGLEKLVSEEFLYLEEENPEPIEE
jgi:hypothetical protein